jgi:hypothetical protein
MTIQLTPTQQAILDHALQHTAGRIDWFPPHIHGGAQQKVLEGLCNRALITALGDDWIVATAGYAALGLPAPDAAVPATVHQPEASQPMAAEVSPTPPKATRTRETSKQAQVLAMLRRPEGATLAQITEATGWLSHTVRGHLAGGIKKKLGLTLTSEKSQGVRVYRIASEPRMPA